MNSWEQHGSRYYRRKENWEYLVVASRTGGYNLLERRAGGWHWSFINTFATLRDAQEAK